MGHFLALYQLRYDFVIYSLVPSLYSEIHVTM